MRKIDPGRFQIATQGTSREINRQIVLNLVRANQPISRADLARTMGVRRGSVSLIVNDLLESGLLVEGATGKTDRGRKPTFLYIDSRRRTVIAVDVRATQTFVMLADLLGKPLTRRDAIPDRARSEAADRDARPRASAACSTITAAQRVRRRRRRHPRDDRAGDDAGDARAAARLAERRPAGTAGCRHRAAGADRELRPRLRPGAAVGDAHARRRALGSGDLVFVTVSDGLGLGVIVHGELLRGRHNAAGEFGHVPLTMDGPRCSCGATGCWEAYVSNRATVARYFGRPAESADPVPAAEQDFTIEDLIARARGGDAGARSAIQATGRYLGAGLVSVVSVFDPARVYIGGEITAAWDLIEGEVRAALVGRALTPAAAAMEMRPVAASEYPRLQGAAALFNAAKFAAPVVA